VEKGLFVVELKKKVGVCLKRNNTGGRRFICWMSKLRVCRIVE
jgi:hypothetical protein